MLKNYKKLHKKKRDLERIEKIKEQIGLAAFEEHVKFMIAFFIFLGIFVFFGDFIFSYPLIFFVIFTLYFIVARKIFKIAEKRNSKYRKMSKRTENKLKEIKKEIEKNEIYYLENNIEAYVEEVNNYKKGITKEKIPDNIIDEVLYLEKNEMKIFKKNYENLYLDRDLNEKERKLNTALSIPLLISSVIFVFSMLVMFNNNITSGDFLDNLSMPLIAMISGHIVVITFFISFLWNPKKEINEDDIKYLDIESYYLFYFKALSKIEPEKLSKFNPKFIDEIYEIKDRKDNIYKTNKERVDELFQELENEEMIDM